MIIKIIGAGAWGTTMSRLLSEDKDNQVYIWCNEDETMENINKYHENKDFLPKISLHEKIKAYNDLEETFEETITIIAVPSVFFEDVVGRLKVSDDSSFMVLTKGMRRDGKFLSDIISERFPDRAFAFLSGPNLAGEIADKQPASAVMAGDDERLTADLQKLLFRDYFRVYTSKDYKGLQIGGMYKNILAIGAGICDAMGFGLNTKAAYLTRGLMEMARFGSELGCQPFTFMGLSGVGDLIATANSRLSRNYSFGYKIVESKEAPLKIYKGSRQAIEGVEAVRIAVERYENIEIQLPIAHVLHDIIFSGLSYEKGVDILLNREPKKEIY